MAYDYYDGGFMMESDVSTKPVNWRRHRRAPVNTYAGVQWEDASGRMNFARARVLDVSEGGVGCGACS
jgi:hypothetical protein